MAIPPQFVKGYVKKGPSKVATALGKTTYPPARNAGPDKPTQMEPQFQTMSDSRSMPGAPDGGMGSQPILKNSKVFNRLKELKGK